MPQPPLVLSVQLELQDKAQQAQLDEAIQELQKSNAPRFKTVQEPADSRTLLHGCTELELAIIIDKIAKAYGIKLSVGAPQVAYRETITRHARIDYAHKSRSGEPAQFASLLLLFDPQASGTGELFKNAIRPDTLPQDYVAAIAEGLAAAKECGVFAGFPCVDFMATLTGGANNEASSPEAFTTAARAAFRQGMAKAQPVLLEPIMRTEVATPEDYLGDVIADLNSRRGMILALDSAKDNIRIVEATVPLVTMFGYENKLGWLTKGRAECHMEYSHYDRVPPPSTPAPPDDRFPPATALRA